MKSFNNSLEVKINCNAFIQYFNEGEKIFLIADKCGALLIRFIPTKTCILPGSSPFSIDARNSFKKEIIVKSIQWGSRCSSFVKY